MASNRKLWYQSPAHTWEEALPLGNGSFGAMVYGGVDIERIQLNCDTFWSGYPRDKTNPRCASRLDDIRRLAAEGRYKQAQDVVEETMFGPYSESYLPLGNVYLQSLTTGAVSGYCRTLDLTKAVHTCQFTKEQRLSAPGYTLRRETLLSRPHDVLATRITGSEQGKVSVAVWADSEVRHTCCAQGDGMLVVSGRAPSHVTPLYKPCDAPVEYDDTKPVIGFAFVVWNGAAAAVEQQHDDQHQPANELLARRGVRAGGLPWPAV